ncbi:MAG: M23 family metallopeptidase [Deltaproteobacteria bacterium]|nr:M23 family metallopeptidase [Deltaproteobacteria bacterium]
MRRALPLLALLGGCASTPAPKMGWAEAGYASSEADENAASATLTSDEISARAQLSPLAVSTYRFGGVERVLRAQGAGEPMPLDGLRAWNGLFAAVDQTLSGQLKASRNDLLRARVAVEAELDEDHRAYRALPDGLEAAAHARSRALGARLGSSRRAPNPADDLLAWPVHPAQVTSLFGPRLDPLDHQSWKRHEGVDIAADAGELVTAAARGVVVEADRRQGYGLLVAIRHLDGTITRYGHLSQLLARQGDAIERGGAVGLAGATGRATGPHVHFEVWRHGRAVDPLEELGDPDEDESSAVSRTN